MPLLEKRHHEEMQRQDHGAKKSSEGRRVGNRKGIPNDGEPFRSIQEALRLRTDKVRSQPLKESFTYSSVITNYVPTKDDVWIYFHPNIAFMNIHGLSGHNELVKYSTSHTNNEQKTVNDLFITGNIK